MILYRSPINAHTGPLELTVARQSVRLRARQTIHSAPMVLGGAGVVAVVFGALGSVGGGAAWGATVVLAALLNRAMCVRIEKLPDSATPHEIARAEQTLWWLTVLNTLAMGMGLWWVGLTTDARNLWFMTTVVQALYTLAALINASTHPPTFIAGARINLGLAALFWLTRGGEGLVVAFTLVALTSLVTRFSRQIKADYDDMVRIQFEKDELLRRLRHETLAAESARAAAEHANLAKSKFLAAASHDLRQPLHTLMLFASLLERATPGQQGEFIDHIRSAADTLNKLFSSLLDLSKLDSGAVTPKSQSVNSSRLLASIAAEQMANCTQKGLDLVTTLEPAHVWTDPFLFERIVRNLLDNAIKYTEHGSVELRSTLVDGVLNVAIIDTGVGIRDEEQQRIFDEFYQIGNPARHAERGTGLGLAIVQRLCRLLGHPISVRSESGRGSAFEIAVPIAAAELPAQQAGAASALDATRSLTGRRIVIVDDDDRVREAMGKLITSWHGEPVLIASFDELRAEIANWRGDAPAAVIADYRLGSERNGFDAIRELRSAHPALPAAVFTGDTDAFLPDSERMPEVPVFQKPVSAAEIIDWLASTLAGEEPAPAAPGDQLAPR